jgi:hypothetical protein
VPHLWRSDHLSDPHHDDVLDNELTDGRVQGMFMVHPDGEVAAIDGGDDFMDETQIAALHPQLKADPKWRFAQESQGTPEAKGTQGSPIEVIRGATDSYDEYDDWFRARRPAIFREDLRKVYVGQPGTHHEDIKEDFPDVYDHVSPHETRPMTHHFEIDPKGEVASVWLNRLDAQTRDELMNTLETRVRNEDWHFASEDPWHFRYLMGMADGSTKRSTAFRTQGDHSMLVHPESRTIFLGDHGIHHSDLWDAIGQPANSIGSRGGWIPAAAYDGKLEPYGSDIDPDLWQEVRSQFAPAHQKLFGEKLNLALPGDWRFAGFGRPKWEGEPEPWQPGEHGKWMLYPDGSVESWMTYGFGSPHHEDIRELRHAEKGFPVGYGEISPGGYLDSYGSVKDIQHVLPTNPDFKMREKDAWHFGALTDDEWMQVNQPDVKLPQPDPNCKVCYGMGWLMGPAGDDKEYPCYKCMAARVPAVSDLRVNTPVPGPTRRERKDMARIPMQDLRVGQVKTADKLHDFLMNPKSRPDLQTPEAQALLQKLENHFHNEKTDALLPWLVREWKKGRLQNHGLHPQALSYGEHQWDLRPEQLNHWADWYKSNHPTARGDIMQKKIDDVRQHVNEWSDEMKAKAHEEALQSAEVTHRYPDNWTLQRLNNAEQCAAEGDAMGHCVGGYGPDVEHGNTMIYSLRDHKNAPHATMEITPSQWERAQQTPVEHAFENHPVGRALPDHVKKALLDYEGWHDFDRSPDSEPTLEGADLASLHREFSRNAPKGNPIPHRGEVVQIQGKANQEPLPEYKARLKDWFKTFPDDDRPKWADDEYNGRHDDEGYWIHELTEPDHITDEDFRPHGAEDEYGLKARPLPADYDRLLNNIGVHDYGYYNTHDTGHVNRIYELAKSRGEIPALSKAAEDYQGLAQDQFDEWMEQNYQHREHPYDPDAWDQLPPDEARKAEKAYEDEEEAWMMQYPHMMAARQLYNHLNKHYFDGTSYTNALQEPEAKPTTFSKVARKRKHRAHHNWSTGLPCFCGFTTYLDTNSDSGADAGAGDTTVARVAWEKPDTSKPPEIVHLDEDELAPLKFPEEWTGPGTRLPFVYHPDDHQVVVGPPDAVHSEIDPNNHGAPGIIWDKKNNGKYMVEGFWDGIPENVLRAVADSVGGQVKGDYGWHFGGHYEPRALPEWGIGKPNRVWGKTADAANPEPGEYEWPLSQPRVQLHWPTGWNGDPKAEGVWQDGRVPFAWTHHTQDPNDVHVYFGYPGGEHDGIFHPGGKEWSYSMQDYEDVPPTHPGLTDRLWFDRKTEPVEDIGGYGSVKPQSWYTGNPNDKSRALEFYTIHSPQAMGSVADAISAHPSFGLSGDHSFVNHDRVNRHHYQYDDYEPDFQEWHFGSMPKAWYAGKVEDDPYYDPEFPTEEEQDAADEKWWDGIDPANVNPPTSLDELHPWKPGKDGKGILMSDGSVITWTDNFHHQQVAQLLDPSQVRAFLDHIDGGGYVLMDLNSTPEDRQMVAATGLVPDQNQWSF